MLRDTSAMTAERDVLRMGDKQLTTLFPVETSDLEFVIENEGRQIKYKLNAQSVRLFGLRNNDDGEDVHRAGANRLKKKKQKFRSAPVDCGTIEIPQGDIRRRCLLWTDQQNGNSFLPMWEDFGCIEPSSARVRSADRSRGPAYDLPSPV